LKHGKKRKVPEATEKTIRNNLCEWRDKDLLDKFYPGVSIMSGATLLGDDIVEKLTKCGERIENGDDLAQHVRWPIVIDAETHTLTAIGHELLAKLQTIYQIVDNKTPEEEAHMEHLHSLPKEIDTASFYQGSSTQTRQRTTRTINSDGKSDSTEGIKDNTTNQNIQRGVRGVVRGGTQGTTRYGRPPRKRARG
jgi:hypothetical protein